MESRIPASGGSQYRKFAVVTGDPVLGIDLSDALTTVGLPEPARLGHVDAALVRASRPIALIVDADALDDAGLDAVRACIKARHAVVVIADNPEVARRMEIPDGLWFPKPVSADHLVGCLVDLIGRMADGGCSANAQA